MGRRPKTLTPEQKAQVEALAAFLSKEQIADYFGVARNTFTAIMEREPDVAERFARGRARAIGAIAKGVIDRAQNGDQRSAEFYLERVGGWASNAKREVKHEMTPNQAAAALAAAYEGGSDS